MSERDKSQAYCSVDTHTPIRLNAHEYAIKGWFLPQSDLPEIQRLTVRVDGLESEIFTGLPRPDVAEHFNDPDAANSGFIARFRTATPNPRITVVAQNGGREIVLHDIQAALAPDAPPISKAKAATYLEWITGYEPDLFWREEEIEQRLSSLPWLPLISVIVVAYDTDPYLLARCIGSVLQQRYHHVELCVCDNCSTVERVPEYLYTVSSGDARIRVIRLGEHNDLSTARNHALMAAQGEIITFLNERDELHPFALLEVARHLNSHRDTALIYSDEDTIDYLGSRNRPVFKPDFDIDAFLSFNYLGHLTAVTRSLALGIGGFRPAYDAVRDWDFLLRSAEQVGVARIHHISKPLYHRRISEGDPAVNGQVDASLRSLAQYVERMKRPVGIEPGLFPGSVRLRYLSASNIRVAILLRAEDGGFQTTVLRPNLSEGRTVVYELVDCVVRRTNGVLGTRATGSEPRPYDAPIVSLDETNEQVYIFINAPLETINHFFVEELISQAMRDDCGLVTGLSIDSNNRILHSGFLASIDGEPLDLFAGTEFAGSGYAGQPDVVRAVDTISDYFFAVRRKHLASVGGLGSVCASRMPQLVSKLISNAEKHQLRVLVTPYAVAAFDRIIVRPAAEIYRGGPPHITVNPNLVAFRDLKVLQAIRKSNLWHPE